MSHLTETTLNAKINKRFKSARKEKQLNFAYWVLLAFFFLEYIRPQTFFPVIGLLRPALFVSIILILAWVANGDKNILKETPILILILFIILSGISILYAVNYYWAFIKTKTLIVYCFAGILPMIMLLSTYNRFRNFIIFWLFMHVFISVMGTLNDGVGYGSFVGDENDLATTLNMVIPYAWFMSQSRYMSILKRIIYLSMVVIFVLGVISTFSRGGFLGLLSVILGIIIFSKNRIRNIILLVVLGGSIFLSVMDDVYMTEMKTITDTEDSTRNERFHSWKLARAMFLDNSVLGVGAGNYPWNAGKYELILDENRHLKKGRSLGGRAAHSVYYTVIPEFGLVGVIIFIIMIYSLYIRLRQVLKLDNNPELTDKEINDYCLFARAILVSLLAFLVSGVFLSIFYYPHLWYLVGFVIVLERLTVKRLAQINQQH